MVPATDVEPARCTTVVVSHRALEPFLHAAVRAYRSCTPTEPPSCFAVLVGAIRDGRAVVHTAEIARCVRATDSTATEEFRTAVVPRFGTAYDNVHRGFWCDPADLLRIQRHADKQELDIIGSLHLHPDWHRIGPPAERGLRISEAPTPMDAYMFGNTGWPVNMICYVEPTGQQLSYTLAAWGPPSGAQDSPCAPLHLKFRMDPEEGRVT